MPLDLLYRSLWRTPRLGIRLAAAFGGLILVMAAVVALSVHQLRALAAHGDELLGQDLQRMLKLQQIHQHAQGHGVAIARLLTAPREERERIYPAVDTEYAQIEQLIGEVRGSTRDLESAGQLERVAALGQAYRGNFVSIVERIEGGDSAEARDLFYQTGQPALHGLLQASRDLLALEERAIARRQATIRADSARSEWLLGALALGAACVSVGLAWRTTASVARPLARVEAAARRIAGGNYSTRVEVRAGDEIGKVGEAMNAMATAVAAREAEVERLAFFDRLTGLPNRTCLRRMDAEQAPGARTAIVLDLARLRMINDVLGFEAADTLLRGVVERLQGVLRDVFHTGPRPPVISLGGGSFAVICRDTSRYDAERLREWIDLGVAGRTTCAGQPVDVALVYGLADCRDRPDLPIDTLLREAELAVGDAKRLRRGWVWYAGIDDGARAMQLSLLSDLRHAAASGQLEMWLQPKLCLRSGRIAGMEGLVRWRHPSRGFISPADFIPFAEQTGHIGIVTQAMLGTAASTLARWRDTHPTVSISVNVSTVDIRDERFPLEIERLARRHGPVLDRLRLEITEGRLMEDADRVLPVLQTLRAMGVRLAIDDFGTGYSSLAYLHRLPVTELKIDRSFVGGAPERPEAQALLRTIVDLGRSLGLEVTGEGIEREDERHLLAALGCDYAQGYLVSRPMPPDAALAFLDDRTQPAALPLRP